MIVSTCLTKICKIILKALTSECICIVYSSLACAHEGAGWAIVHLPADKIDIIKNK